MPFLFVYKYDGKAMSKMTKIKKENLHVLLPDQISVVP